MPQRNTILSVGLFFAKPAHKLAHALDTQLQQHVKNYESFSGIQITSWDEGFFGRLNVSPLDEFFRKLHSLDGAIFLLTEEVMEFASETASTDRSGQHSHLNENVLLELGASIAKLGKARTFIVTPDTGAVRLPSYFKNNPLPQYTYESSKETSEIESIVGYTAKNILTALENLGDSVFFSDLPSFGLTSGYVYNFLKPLIEHLERGSRVIPSDATSDKFTLAKDGIKPHDYKLIIFIPSSKIVLRQDLYAKLEKFGWGEFVIPVKDGRDITFYGSIAEFRNGQIHVYEVPTNLRPSLDAIKLVERNWLISQVDDPKFQELLARREIRSFRRYLDIMVYGRESPLSEAQRERVQIVEVDTINQVGDIT